MSIPDSGLPGAASWAAIQRLRGDVVQVSTEARPSRTSLPGTRSPLPRVGTKGCRHHYLSLHHGCIFYTFKMWSQERKKLKVSEAQSGPRCL